jgi:putative transposase
MQVFGLPFHIIRNGRAASRLLTAKTPQIAAARRDAVQRWRGAMADGLSAEQAARAVGVPRPTLYRWERRPEPLSRRPHRPRGRQWTHKLVRAVEDLRNDNPMWGKRKIAVLSREGFIVSISTIGRILAHLVKRGAIVPVPLLRRRPQARRICLTAKERYARRLPKGRKAKSPGELVQIDTLFVNMRPDKPIKHFTAYDPIAKWTIGRVCTKASAASAKSLLDKLLIEAPFPIRGIQVDGGAEFKSVFEAECQVRASISSCCRPSGPISTAASSAPNRPGATSSMPPTICRSNRQAAGLRRRLRSQIQPSQTARRPWRKNSGRVSSNSRSRRPPAVSYVMSPDSGFRRADPCVRRRANFAGESPHGCRTGTRE